MKEPYYVYSTTNHEISNDHHGDVLCNIHEYDLYGRRAEANRMEAEAYGLIPKNRFS